MGKDQDQIFMQQALQLAMWRRGFCAPNPAVGAVAVRMGQVVGEGTHWACGEPHAEVMALQSLREGAADITLYVTLEPCTHHGRTPPCTDLIIRSGVREVVFAMTDPNLNVSGQGREVLRQAGVICRQLPSPAVEDFYRSYRYWLATRLPWVTAKLAISLDGKIAGPQGVPVSLTGPECQQLTHQRRLHSDAILTTAATIIADNPQLNIRLGLEKIAKPIYILDTHLSLPSDAQILQTAKSITVFHCQSVEQESCERLEKMKIRCVPVSSDDTGLRLLEVLTFVGADGCQDLWVEAGGRCFQSFLMQNLAQCVLIYVAPKILGFNAISAFTQPSAWSPDSAQIAWHSCGADMIMEVDYGTRQS